MNELDDIYREWKENGRNKKLGSNGVPDPVINSQYETNFSDARCCPECGSLNIGLDMATNETVCNDCKGKTKTSARLDFQQKIEKEKEIELKNIEEAIKRGVTFKNVG